MRPPWWYFRKPYGKGWALVGDAGYNRDPITAQGISDAFIDAEMLADAPLLVTALCRQTCVRCHLIASVGRGG